jgi:23S rRNA (guanosine2251-2'-O)-methyltransferase
VGDQLENIEGRNAVLEALRSQRPLDKIYLVRANRSKPLEEIRRLAREQGIAVQELGKRRLDQISVTQNHQGVIARAPVKAYVGIEEILAVAEDKKQAPLLLILDGIEDPHNLGALIRSAEGAGAHGVVITKHRAAGLTAAVSRASAGAVEYMPVAQVTNLARCLDSLKEAGLWIVGTEPSGEHLYTEVDLVGPIGIVIGSEGQGIRRLVKEKCDFLVRLPLRGRISSLNASVAGSLLMYEADRQRTKRE